MQGIEDPGGGSASFRRTGARRPMLVGRSCEGSLTIRFLDRVATPVPGPWCIAMVIRADSRTLRPTPLPTR